MSPKTIFILGASGFIGIALVKEAVSQGYLVRGLSRSEISDSKITQAGGVPVRGDLTTADVLARESANADTICYFASAFPNSGVSYDESVKLNNAAVDVIGAAIEGTNKPLIVASTVLITAPDPNGEETTEGSPEDPTPFYDRSSPSKHALAWARRGVRVATIRLSPAIYGPGDSVISMSSALAAAVGGVPIVEGGNTQTSSVHVGDAARLALLAAEKTPPGECYNCASDNDTTMGEVLTAAANALDLPVKDLMLEEARATIGDMFAGYLTTPCRASSNKARGLLGWQPKEVGILEYYKNFDKTT
ncbi:hypothetical protein jhhlp_000408 [Lomentospora prolificans]|uniref:NAD-dependent epimerase/dehydratase domain-containing protein n=1 Tax=Lomentospora prolificans TaxID=41688 RepID=A0A2N3NKU9_9PEZI|nr:hypothetical protein jhhlp_000408 [Lomentospora prolificans]